MQLFPYLKMAIDENRSKNGQYILTGSQIFQLMQGVSESLASRIAIFHLYPLSWQEIKAHQKNIKLKDDLVMAERLIEGFYPSFWHEMTDVFLWWSSYLATYLERDVRNILSIQDLSRFQTFVSLLAARVGNLLNLNDLATTCGITQPTAKNWLTVLESTYIIQLLKPYYRNVSKRFVKSPKVYFTDTGLLCYLLGINTSEQFFAHPAKGALFENMVVMEMIKNAQGKSEKFMPYFYRTTTGVEADLVVEDSKGLSIYEIKLAKTLSHKGTKPLESIGKDLSSKELSILSLYDKDIALSKLVQGRHWSSIID